MLPDRGLARVTQQCDFSMYIRDSLTKSAEVCNMKLEKESLTKHFSIGTHAGGPFLNEPTDFPFCVIFNHLNVNYSQSDCLDTKKRTLKVQQDLDWK